MPKRPAPKNGDVDQFIAQLEHPFKAQIAALRQAILASNPEITEQIKWKAPSFCIDGDDRVTFRLHPPDAVHLVFHRGVKVKDATNFTFADPTGLMKWAAQDRAQVTLRTPAEATQRQSDVVDLVTRWMAATR